MDEDERRIFMIAMAAIGGAMVSLWSMPWRTMTIHEKGFAFFGGISIGVFGAPWLAKLMNISTTQLSEQCGVVFFGAAFGLILMPSLQNKIAKTFGLRKEDEA